MTDRTPVQYPVDLQVQRLSTMAANKPPASYAPIYAALYPQLAEIARKHGYAMAVHGSLQRDFDVVCVPWDEAPSDPQVMLDEITSTFAIKLVGGEPTEKPHSRIAYTISIAFGECAIDISFMPRVAAEIGRNMK